MPTAPLSLAITHGSLLSFTPSAAGARCVLTSSLRERKPGCTLRVQEGPRGGRPFQMQDADPVSLPGFLSFSKAT